MDTLTRCPQARDVEEGADMVMVKPGGAYLDIIRDVKEQVGTGVFRRSCVSFFKNHHYYFYFYYHNYYLGVRDI